MVLDPCKKVSITPKGRWLMLNSHKARTLNAAEINKSTMESE